MSLASGTAAIFSGTEAALGGLRRRARAEDPQALDEVARRFEGLFLEQMLKTMRQASGSDPLFGGPESKMFTGMFDQQLASDLAGKQGLGLADMLKRQLRHERAQPAAALDQTRLQRTSRRATLAAPASASAPVSAPTRAAPESGFAGPADFVRRLWPLARPAAAELGVAPEALIAQAALETGWGQHLLRDGDGRNSHNLFNIKADGRWDGPAVQRDSLEFEGGIAVRRASAFRAYGSYAQSFADYAAFLKANPRYAAALEQGEDPFAFSAALQEAGYATDPAYAAKIHRILRSDALAAAAHPLQENAPRTLT